MKRLKLSMIIPLLYVPIALVGCGGGSLSSGNNGGGGNGGGGGSSTSTPTISSVSPTFVPAGSQNQTVTITGTNFVQGSSVGWSSGGGQPQTLGGTFVSSTELQLSLSATSVGGIYQLTVTNPGGATSAPVNFTVVGFVSTAKLNTATASQTATLLGNDQVMVAGGDGGTCFSNGNPTGPGNCTAGTAVAEVYSPSANSFSLIHSMNMVRTLHTATLLPNGSVLIAGGGPSGGYCNNSPTATTELYNLTTQVFAYSGSMLTARMCATATLLPDGKVLIAGGDDGTQSLASAELYDPASGTFTATGSMTTARENHTATLLPNGQVLIAGGVALSGGRVVGPYSSAELYNPTTATFTATTEGMITARFDHTATLLSDGEVLIAGGEKDYIPTLIGTAELYNPTTEAFTSTGNLVKPRSNHTSTPLANGQILLVGGSYDTTAELYDPTKGSFSATASTSIALWGQTTTMLPSLQPFIVGGFNMTQGGQLVNSELYVPPPVETPLLPVATAVSPSSVSPGSVVVIQGSSFLPNFTVSLDGATIPTPVFLDETLIGFTIPSGTSAGSHSVSVSNPAGGTSAGLTLTVQ